MNHVRLGDGDTIAYQEFGSGTPLFLVPGLGGVGAYWKPNIAAFACKYRVIIHDHRGTGDSSSSRSTYCVEQMTSDMIAVMNDLGIDRAHVVGHSTGGAMAQVMALDNPQRLLGLVLYATWTSADPFMRRILEARKTLALSAGPKAYLSASPIFLYPDWYVNEHDVEMAEAEVEVSRNFHSMETVAARIDGILAFDRKDSLSRITAPTLVLGVEDDILTPAKFSRDIAAVIPGAQCEIVDRGGHALSMTRPEEFNRIVLQFLDRIDAIRS